MTVALVASDLDGTLLLPGEKVSPRVARALAAVQGAGITVVLVTARSFRTVGAIAERLGVSGLAICSNGAVVYDLAREEIVHRFPLETAVAQRFIEQCRAQIGDVGFAWDTPQFAYRDQTFDAISEPWPEIYVAMVKVVDAMGADHDVTKLLVRHVRHSPDELLDLIAPIAGEELHATLSGGPFVELSAPGITKAHALAIVCEERGIPAAHVVALGDQPNDIPMLAWAGHGVAMGNSHPAVLAAIPTHTQPVEHDGAAIVLESLLP